MRGQSRGRGGQTTAGRGARARRAPTGLRVAKGSAVASNGWPAGGARRPAVAQRRVPTLTAAAGLLRLARHGLAEAVVAEAPAERYVTAHLAALRSAAALLAARADPIAPAGRRRPRSAWSLLADVAPEMAEWAAFFAAGAAKRAAAEAGLATAVTAREADDLIRDAGTFLALVETTLGLARQRPEPPSAASAC